MHHQLFKPTKMSQDSHETAQLKKPESSKNLKRLIFALVAGFLIPITVIGLLISYVHHTNLPNAGTDAMSASAIKQRIAPVAQLALQEMPASAVEASGAADNSVLASQAATDRAQAEAIAAAIAAIPAATSAVQGGTNQTETAQTGAGAGKALYMQICQTCHTAGLLGAPKLGDKADWAPRLQSPVSEIYRLALQGKGSMPPKGGSNASDEEVKAAVDYMLKAVK